MSTGPIDPLAGQGPKTLADVIASMDAAMGQPAASGARPLVPVDRAELEALVARVVSLEAANAGLREQVVLANRLTVRLGILEAKLDDLNLGPRWLR